MKSPFRVDKNPSFSIRKWGNYYVWKDWSNKETGNCFDFVAKYYGLNVKREFNIVLEKIVKDLNYEHLVGINKNILIDIIARNKQLNSDIRVVYDKTRESGVVKLKYNKKQFNIDEINYWKSQGLLDISTLKYLDVHSVNKAYLIIKDYVKEIYNYVSHKDTNFKKLLYCFAYNYGNKYVKLYRPYYIDKWKSTVPANTICTKTLFGNDTLIVTKAKKEQIHLLDIQKYLINKFDILPLNNENNLICYNFDKYKKVILWLDHDIVGINNMKEWSEMYNVDWHYTKRFKNITDQYEHNYQIDKELAIKESLWELQSL